MISLKPGVDISKLHRKLWHAASVLDEVVEEVMGMPQEIIITAGRNGKHSDGSKHYQVPCKALDFRTHNLQKVPEITQKLSERLGKDFYVLYEYPGTNNAHIHVQYGQKEVR